MAEENNRNSCYEVMLHKLCNERCLFCSQDHESRTTDVRPDDMDIYKRIMYGYKKGYGMLGFTGGEPLIHPNVLKYIQFGKKIGFRFIRIQTNGVMLGHPGFAEKCVDAGGTVFKFSIHHYKSEVHDYLVGLPGAFEKVLHGIRELKRLGSRVGINIVLTEQNYRDLPEFLMFFLNMGVTSFVIIYPLYENSMDDEGGLVGFKFTDTMKYLIKSFKIFDKLGLKRPLALNLPMCLAPGYDDSIIIGFNGTAVLNLDGSQTKIDDFKAGGKKRVPICGECKFNKQCFGVDQEYLKHWGEGEFQVQKEQLDYSFNLEELEIKNYFTEDELCLFEILKIKERASVDDIIELKEGIQICQDCDSVNKIISTAEILVEKGLVIKKMDGGKMYFKRVVKDI